MAKVKIISPMEMRTLPAITLSSFGATNRRQQFWLGLKRACRDYIEESKVNGLFYLRADDSTKFQKIFWCTTIILAFSFGGIVLHQLIAKFFEVPFQMTLASPEILLSIPFPSITLCHPQTVITFNALKFVDKIKIPIGLNKSDVMSMLPTALGVFNENQWGSININYLSTINEILELNELSVLEAVREVGIKCPEFVIRCSFNKKRFPCFQDNEFFTFRETISHIGICCSFNFNPLNSSYEPLKTNSYGVRGGLSLIGTSHPHKNDGSSGLLYSDGFFLLIHPPYDYPTDATTMALLEVGKITSVGIYPTISSVSTDVKALPLQSRKCLIGSDVDLSIYRRPACAIGCLRKFIYEKCGCHPYFLPKLNENTFRDCIVLDGDCFQKIYYDMKKIRCNSCLPACEDISYRMSTATIAYSFANTSINPMYEQTSVSTAEFTSHIYFAGSTVPVKNMIISQSFIQLLSNFGGVFNLVLGISIVSIFELVYYFFIKFPQYMKKHEKVRPVINIITPANNMFR